MIAFAVSIMLPPTMPVLSFILAMTTLVLGMLSGWAWSCAAMAASLAARDRVLLSSQLQRVQSRCGILLSQMMSFNTCSCFLS